MMRTIHLDTLEGLPGKYITLLRNFSKLFEEDIFLDSIMEREPIVKEIVMAINSYCNKNFIKAYHYTRAYESHIKQVGLLCRDGDAIRTSFLEQHSNRFTQNELVTIKESWEKYFSERQRKIRDNRIWFNTTEIALRNGGAAPLLNTFGGEQIHMPLNGHTAIHEKLSQVGVPLIVIFKVAGNETVGVGQQFPWGMTAVSTFHRLLNKEAYMHDVDAYINKSVTVANIIDVRIV